MHSVIKAVVIACTLLGLVVFIKVVTETNAREKSAQLVLQHRNEVQQQFADERQQMKSYVLSTVEREFSKATHNRPK
ncbi:hypothetical protein HA62_06685 [Pseudomonas putida]|nr:hypothetical protein HA62_06685 [Pseudomonas putida]